MGKNATRMAVVAGTVALVAVTFFWMDRLPWEVDAAIAAAAVIAFAYYFERDDPPYS